MQRRSAKVDGIPMGWMESGTGQAVVFVHGIPTGPSLWRHVIPRVPGVRCLAWEMVGYAASIPEGIGRDLSVRRQAGYLRSWMDHLGIDRALLVGHDLGGGVVQVAATTEPSRCAGLLLTNAICYDSWPIPSVKMMRAGSGLLRHMPDAGMKLLLGTLMARGHDTAEQAREALDCHWPPYRDADGAAALARQVNAMNVADTRAVEGKLSGLRVPARIVWGTGDPFQKLHYGERLARDLDAPLRRIDGAKHFTPEDHPDVIAEELQELVRTAA